MRGIVPDKADKTRFNRVYTLIRQICSFWRVNKKPPAEPRAKYQEQLSQPFDLPFDKLRVRSGQAAKMPDDFHQAVGRIRQLCKYSFGSAKSAGQIIRAAFLLYFGYFQKGILQQIVRLNILVKSLF